MCPQLIVRYMCQQSAAEGVRQKQDYEQYKHKLQLQQEQQCKQRHSHESQEEEEHLQTSRREEDEREEEQVRQRQRAPVHGPHGLRFPDNAANVQAAEREEKQPPSMLAKLLNLFAPSSRGPCVHTGMPSLSAKSQANHPRSSSPQQRTLLCRSLDKGSITSITVCAPPQPHVEPEEQSGKGARNQGAFLVEQVTTQKTEAGEGQEGEPHEDTAGVSPVSAQSHVYAQLRTDSVAVALAKLAVARQRRSQVKHHLLQLHAARQSLEALRLSQV
jgi:hypothetical protein